jgi:hypothetical protein
MAQWRIRIIVPDIPSGQSVLRSALALVPGTDLRLDPPGADAAELTGDVTVEVGEDGALADLLRTLHEISPQVFISRVPSPEPTAAPAAGQPIRVRRLAPQRRAGCPSQQQRTRPPRI